MVTKNRVLVLTLLALAAITLLLATDFAGLGPPSANPPAFQAPSSIATLSSWELLRGADKCREALWSGKGLVLYYGFSSNLWIFGGDRMLWVNGSDATLEVRVEPLIKGVYNVTFTLRVLGLGRVAGGPSTESISLLRSFSALYSPRDGYRLPNGALLGELFPLSEACGHLELNFTWRGVGGGSLVSVRALGLDPVYVIVANLTAGQLYRLSWPNLTLLETLSLTAETSARARELLRSQRPLCADILAVLSYKHMELPMFVLEYDRAVGAPLCISLLGGVTYAPNATVVWNGRRVSEMPSSPLASLLGIGDWAIACLERVEMLP